MYDHTHAYIRKSLNVIRQFADDGALVRAAYAACQLDDVLRSSPDVNMVDIREFMLDICGYLVGEELRLRRSMTHRERRLVRRCVYSENRIFEKGEDMSNNIKRSAERVREAIKEADEIVEAALCPRRKMFPDRATVGQRMQAERGWEECVMRVAEMILQCEDSD